MKNIVVTGANGLLGKDIVKSLRNDSSINLISIGRKDHCVIEEVNYIKCDLYDLDRVSKLVKEIKPDIIVHCAANTKMDDCELNKEYAYKVNVDVVECLAKNTDWLIYISSDGVFNGKKGSYTINDECSPISFYGETKLAGEIASKRAQKYTIIRTSMYGYKVGGDKSIAQWGIDNLNNNIEFNGFTDVIFNPMYTFDIASFVNHVIGNNLEGLYHIGCDEKVSKYEFFCRIAKHLKKPTSLIIPSKMTDFIFTAKRTENTTLIPNIDFKLFWH